MKILEAVMAILLLIASLVNQVVGGVALLSGDYPKAAAFIAFAILLWLVAHQSARHAGLEDQ